MGLETEQKVCAIEMQEGLSLVMSQGAILAMLPIEQWLDSLLRAEAVGPFLDPTLYMTYIASGKGDLIKEIFGAALRFKTAILAAQKKVAEDPRLKKVY